ncbi:E3 ubiquitin-protein ligase RNF181-like [Ostrinia furnacalis]|uniref:E3 ubiquitin-protein ligase RNF181-like n=1 Tax=Ostrinia furnacalis TaxID=93504 RepID=UPI00103B313B|nr:E3 ubiquitin-protein ligase RNF181-like [Ostrinia furnacalis]
MAGYFEEMGWRELQDGEQPNHLLHMARFMLDIGLHEDGFSGQWPRLPPPASKEVVKNLPEKTIETSDESCTICLKTFFVGEKATTMPCNHQFHNKCILVWLNKTNSCPFCRHELPTDDEGYEAFKKEKKRAVQREQELDILHNSMFS